ncbi:kinase-like domain-containing protein [Cladochytrium replicatum]|nr:kinase-like domain-containing protein [Cladochytrium replicatum]
MDALLLERFNRAQSPVSPGSSLSLFPPGGGDFGRRRGSAQSDHSPGHDSGSEFKEVSPSERFQAQISELERKRTESAKRQRIAGRILDEGNVVERTVSALAASALASGTAISMRWQIGQFLSSGSSGSVHKAINLDSGDLIAVKEIRFSDLATIESLKRSIGEEMDILRMLNHPNIVEYYGVEIRRDRVFIFMEYCPKSMEALLEDEGSVADENVVRNYTKQMLAGLVYLHRMGIVHRDVKPANILFGQDGRLKFVDFGASKVYSGANKSLMGLQGSLGQTPPSAPEYSARAPMRFHTLVINHDFGEQEIDGSHFAGALDVWSMGCCVLEMLTGRKAWGNLDNEWAVMYQIGMSKGSPPLPAPGTVSNAAIEFLMRCFQRPANKRPSAEELQNDPWVVQDGR